MQMCSRSSKSSEPVKYVSRLLLFIEVEEDAHQLDLITNVVDTVLMQGDEKKWMQMERWVDERMRERAVVKLTLLGVRAEGGRDK